jgi:hypothetical protein
MVIPQLLILILGMGLYIMEGYQIVLLINDQELKYFISVIHALVDEFVWPIHESPLEQKWPMYTSPLATKQPMRWVLSLFGF